MRSEAVNRRTFLKTASAGAAMLAAGPAIVGAAQPTSDPVRIGHIGAGVRGWDLIQYTGKIPSAKVVGMCDVYKPHMERGVRDCGNPDVKRYLDYHDMLADPDIEAVVIAAPDHWHEQMLIDASNAGKAVYCEKGWTTSVASAKRMREVIKKNGTVMQLGHQGRQLTAATAAGDMIREGKLGDLSFVKIGRYMNWTPGHEVWRWYGWYTEWNRPDPNQVIKDLDWEKWLGAQEKIDFNERHFWHWRCYWRYGTGQAGDLLSHEMDFVQSVLGYGIPSACSCSGLNAYLKDDREVPDTWLTTYEFEKQNCSLTFEGIMNTKREQTPEFCGKGGRIIFNAIGQSADRFEVYPDEQAWRMGAKPLEPTFKFDPASVPARPSHMEDFLQCVRTKQQPRCNVDEAFIETATFMMSIESYKQKRQVRWDPEKEEIV